MHPAIIAERDATVRQRTIRAVSRDVGRAIDRVGLGAWYRHALVARCEWAPWPTGSLAHVERSIRDRSIIGAIACIQPRCVVTYRPDVEGD